MISFIVPAHNEEAALARTLRTIQASAKSLQLDFEIVVANDASTDRTEEIAKAHGAVVASVNHRQIAATRNSGAKAARGDRFFFVDADTTVNPRTIAAALRAMNKGAVGGGAPVWFEGELPLYGRLLALFMSFFGPLVGFTGGAFMFSTREAFHASGGFDERVFCGEEGFFALRLKRLGRFVVLWRRVGTSGRRFRTMTGLQLIGRVFKLALHPKTAITQRKSVENIWYDSNRSGDDTLPKHFTARLSNGIALAIFLVLLSGPIWRLIPWEWTPMDSAAGQTRYAVAVFRWHAALLFLPAAVVVLLANLSRKSVISEWLKLVALFAFCVWQLGICLGKAAAFWTSPFF